MVDSVDAVVMPNYCFHLRRALGGGHPQEVIRDIDDGGAKFRVIGGCGLGRLLHGEQVNGHARWRPKVGWRPRDKGESGYRATNAEADQRGDLLPPGIVNGTHGVTSFLTALEATMPDQMGMLAPVMR